MHRVRIVTYEAIEKSERLRRRVAEALVARTTELCVVARHAEVDIPRKPRTQAICFDMQEISFRHQGVTRSLVERIRHAGPDRLHGGGQGG